MGDHRHREQGTRVRRANTVPGRVLLLGVWLVGVGCSGDPPHPPPLDDPTASVDASPKPGCGQQTGTVEDTPSGGATLPACGQPVRPMFGAQCMQPCESLFGPMGPNYVPGARPTDIRCLVVPSCLEGGAPVAGFTDCAWTCD